MLFQTCGTQQVEINEMDCQPTSLYVIANTFQSYEETFKQNHGLKKSPARQMAIQSTMLGADLSGWRFQLLRKKLDLGLLLIPNSCMEKNK